MFYLPIAECQLLTASIRSYQAPADSLMLSDEETSLLLHHLLSHPAEPALVPIILSLHSSLVASRTGTASHSTTNTVELFHDFLGSPGDFNDWATPSLPDPLQLPLLHIMTG